MARVLLYYAHPGHRFSHANKAMFAAATQIDGITCVELYRQYPRFDIDIDLEQRRLLDHDVIVFQYPLFWYATPALVKEWLDLVLEPGFAYGAGGDKLAGKVMMLALAAAGPADAYTPEGYQRYPLRTFLAPMERTAGLCRMEFTPPYVLFASLRAADEGRVAPHVEGYLHILEALRDDRYDFARAARRELISYDALPIHQDA